MLGAVVGLISSPAFGTRELYSDCDETIIRAQRPILLTGVDDIVERSDLLSRTIVLALPQIDETERREEKEFREAFGADAGSSLRSRIRQPGVLDALSSTWGLAESVRT